MGISEFHVSVGFYDFLVILILLVLCEFLLVLKVFRCSEKFRTSSFSFLNQSGATQSVTDTNYTHQSTYRNIKILSSAKKIPETN